jgi:hypothetical protein
MYKLTKFWIIFFISDVVQCFPAFIHHDRKGEEKYKIFTDDNKIKLTETPTVYLDTCAGFWRCIHSEF